MRHALFVRNALITLLLSVALAPAGRSQACAVQFEGQWAGPYSFNRAINPGGITQPGYGEIAHAVVLPPPNDGWVLLWCARYCENVDDPLTADYATFLWSSSNPSTVTKLTMPAVVPKGSADLFCGGQFLTDNGLVVALGGTNIHAACNQEPPLPGDNGEKRVWVLDTTKVIGSATPPTWYLNQNDMLLDRWYGNGVQLADGRMLIDGHGGSGGTGPLATARIREYGHIPVMAAPFTLTWDSPPTGQSFYRNWRKNVPGHAACDKVAVQGTGDMKVSGYSHIHQLMDGRALHFTSRNDPAYIPPGPLYLPFFLDFQACQTLDPGEPERWVAGDGTAPAPQEVGAPSVHLIDDSVTPAEELVLSSVESTPRTTWCRCDSSTPCLARCLSGTKGRRCSRSATLAMQWSVWMAPSMPSAATSSTRFPSRMSASRRRSPSVCGRR